MKDGMRIHFWSDWKDILSDDPMNWIGVELLRIHFERAYYKETFELNFALFGFNLCVEWNLDKDENAIS